MPQDYIPREVDINGTIPAITVKQYDNNSRQIHVKFRDLDLTDVDDNTLDLSNTTTTMYIQPVCYYQGSPQKVSFINGTVESAENGTVTFLLPGGVTKRAGTYKCEIWLYGGDTTTHPIISSKPFLLTVEASIKNDSALEATQDMSALNQRIVEIQAIKNRMDVLERMADTGELPAGTVEAEVTGIRTGKSTSYSSAGAAVRASVQGISTYLNATHWGDSPYNYDFDNLPNNIIVPCGVDNTPGAIEAAPNGIAHAPITPGGMTGLILTFGRDTERKNGDVQVFIPEDGGAIWYRQYNYGSNTSYWREWKTIYDKVSQYRAGINNQYSQYNSHVYEYTKDGTFFADRTHWTDLPTSDSDYIITNSRYGGNWMLQTAVKVSAPGIMYNRLVQMTGGTGNYPWNRVSGS